MGRRTPVHAEVTSREGPPEVMIKKFKKKVKKSGILELVRERRHFTKKSQRANKQNERKIKEV